MNGSQGQPGAIVGAVEWIQGVLLGPVATSLAVIAVAAVGMMMLSGRVPVRRGATVILGCFIVFGASSIAKGMVAMSGSTAGDARTPYDRPVGQSELSTLTAPPKPAEDPYAGAAFRR